MATIDKDSVIDALKKEVSTLKKETTSLKREVTKQKKQIFYYEKMLKPIKDFVVADNVRNDSIKYFHTLAASYLKLPAYEAKQAQQVE
jgi:predicted RNase H-like nuclease (RuvC/YqgF family)